MNPWLDLLSKALQITILDLTLSADNIGVIALATKNLPEKYAKKASAAGVFAAVGLRILFACFITLIMSIQWLPIKLVGGLILVKITWDFIKPHAEEPQGEHVKTANRFWEAIFIIILADLSMSLDNVLAIAAAAEGHVLYIVFGIAVNIPILFFGSQLVSNVMKKYPISIYIGGAILAHTSFKMIFEDTFVIRYLGHSAHTLGLVISWSLAILTLVYGWYLIKKGIIKPDQPLTECLTEEPAVTKHEE